MVSEFGTSVLDAAGDVDRSVLGDLAFNDAAARRRLNKAMHLPVAAEVARQVFMHWLRCKAVVVIDMPLLYETGAQRCTHPNVVVAVPRDMQVQRLMQRDACSPEAAAARVRCQMPLDAKVTRAQQVVDNSGTLEQTRTQVEAIADALKGGGKAVSVATSPIGVAMAAAACMLLLHTG